MNLKNIRGRVKGQKIPKQGKNINNNKETNTIFLFPYSL